MQNEPLVSVIMNCYNGEEYLCDAIDSVINQTYKNWEIIFWDNQSTDRSAKIFKGYNDKRLKYYLAPSHANILYEARNYALKKVNGDFIAFLDVDDWWVKSKLHKQVKVFLKDQTVDVLYSNIYIYNERKKTNKIFIKGKLSHGKLAQKLINKFEMPILSTIIKRSVFNKIKFDDRYSIIGDLDFFVRLSLIKNIAAIQEPLAYYRVHDSNLTKKRADLTIKELESWVSEKSKNKDFKLINFSKIYKLIKILKTKENIVSGNKLKALIEILKRPFLFLPLIKNKFS